MTKNEWFKSYQVRERRRMALRAGYSYGHINNVMLEQVNGSFKFYRAILRVTKNWRLPFPMFLIPKEYRWGETQ